MLSKEVSLPIVNTEIKVSSESNPEKKYTITVNKFGQMSKCTCNDWIFRRQKLGTLCKHQRKLIEQFSN